jgi:lipid-A-disaccharide synthase-like uncharacterized protein
MDRLRICSKKGVLQMIPLQFFSSGMPWGVIITIAFYAGIITLWAFMARWVYKDAQERDMDATLWAVLTFFFGVIALIYFIKRPK